LGIHDSDSLVIHSNRGAIFETLIISELYKQYIHRGLEPPLYFWRDHTGHEVDLLIDDHDRLFPIEIKSGTTLTSDSFAGLQYWLRLNKNPQKKAGLVYAGEKQYTRQGITVIPWDKVGQATKVN
jgi:predicted AAA+ superfamily ATPase